MDMDFTNLIHVNLYYASFYPHLIGGWFQYLPKRDFEVTDGQTYIRILDILNSPGSEPARREVWPEAWQI